MARRRGRGVGVSRVNRDQVHHKGGGDGPPLKVDSTKGEMCITVGPHHKVDRFHVLRDWRTGWMDKHQSKIKAMMQKYLEHSYGQIHLAKILEAAGKTQKDLPTLPKYVHSTGRPFLCWSSVLRKCWFRDCQLHKEGGHPLTGAITEEFADQVIDVIGKGVVYPSIQGWGSPPKKHKGGGAQH